MSVNICPESTHNCLLNSLMTSQSMFTTAFAIYLDVEYNELSTELNPQPSGCKTTAHGLGWLGVCRTVSLQFTVYGKVRILFFANKNFF